MSSDVSQLLRAWSGGDATARERLFSEVYDELRTVAAALFRSERANHTLQPTALVHEAFVRLAGAAALSFTDRAHFFGVAARAMRQVLVDHARARLAAKRGSGVTPITLAGLDAQAEPVTVDVLAVHQALERLAELDPELVALVELRFFAGCSIEETAAALGVSAATVKRDWVAARAFLARELAAGGA